MAGVPHKIIPGKLGGWRPGAGRKKKLPLPDMPGVRIIDGRPIALRAREYTHLALAGLIRALCDPEAPYPAVVNAAREMLDRGYGRAVELKRTLTMGAFDGYSDADLDELITRLRSIETTAPIIDGTAVQSQPAPQPGELGGVPRPETSQASPDAAGGAPGSR
jgi:hypothetical protein